MTTKRHLTYMLIGGGAILVALWAFGVSLATAIPYAFLLACPLMMVFMMRGMDHGSMGHGSMGHGAPRDGTDAGGHKDAPSLHQHPAEPASPDLAGSPDLGSIDEKYRR